MMQELRPSLNNYFKFDWKFGLVLLVTVCVVRFILVLQANMESNYSSISYIMIFSALTPFIFLSKKGRRQIGMVWPVRKAWLLYSFLLGIFLASLLYLMGYLLYTNSIENWYVYIGNSYNIPEGMAGNDKFLYFSVFAVTGMIFSPIGEELFFRGVIHTAFMKSLGEFRASIIDSLAFAITHLSHFGIVYMAGVWRFLPVPSLFWVLSMFISALVFYWCRKKSYSILGAIICHAGFNLGMIFYIFYCLN